MVTSRRPAKMRRIRPACCAVLIDGGDPYGKGLFSASSANTLSSRSANRAVCWSNTPTRCRGILRAAYEIPVAFVPLDWRAFFVFAREVCSAG